MEPTFSACWFSESIQTKKEELTCHDKDKGFLSYLIQATVIWLGIIFLEIEEK